MGERRGVCRAVFGKPKGKRPIGRLKIILRWIFKKWDMGHGLD
jgi:hypothetical protein